MKRSIPLSAAARVDAQKPCGGRTRQVASDLAAKRLAIVNVVFYGIPGARDRGWALIDAGIPGTATLIARAARERFGAQSRPAAILLTHGHFDHVGALATLAERWEVPIYAHAREQPYLDGRAAYPPPGPAFRKGPMAAWTSLPPQVRMDVSRWLKVLPEREVPGMPGWRWLHTPGHAPGHVSFWRDSDRSLIVGDAFITTSQESAYAAAIQRPELHGPPKYYTPDWEEAHDSVQKLAALAPELVITGHGLPMRGTEMRSALQWLACNFDRSAVPEYGRCARALATTSAGRFP